MHTCLFVVQQCFFVMKCDLTHSEQAVVCLDSIHYMKTGKIGKQGSRIAMSGSFPAH